MNAQKGTILVMVLWVLTLLTMLGGFYAVEARIRRNLGQNVWDSLQGREMVRSLLLFSAIKLSSPGTDREEAADEGLLVADGSEYIVKFGGIDVSFILEDENGKLDLNKSSEPQIREVVRGILMDEELEAADTIVDGILDWKDTDKLVRLNGAEDDVYQDRSPPYFPANGPFHILEELLLVNGVGQQVFFGPIEWSSDEGQDGDDDEDNDVMWQGGFWNIFTVYNKSGAVVKDCAPLPLREILDAELSDTTSAREVMCLKTGFGSRIYRVYWKKSGAKKFEVIHWAEGVATESKRETWSESGK